MMAVLTDWMSPVGANAEIVDIASRPSLSVVKDRMVSPIDHGAVPNIVPSPDADKPMPGEIGEVTGRE